MSLRSVKVFEKAQVGQKYTFPVGAMHLEWRYDFILNYCACFSDV